MARFRVRNLANNDWLDVAEHDMYIRNHNKEWTKLEVDKFSVRNVWGRRWTDIDDAYDPKFDNPCDYEETGACGGGPTSRTKGSGNGSGSFGPEFSVEDGYPAGYDLPDAGRSGFGIRASGMPPMGLSIRRPGIKTIESYDSVGVASQYGLGTYSNPNVPWASVHGRGAAVTETIYAVPAYNGHVELLIASYSAGGISVDVYHMGERVASTCGRVTGRSRIRFMLDPTADDMRIMVRVRGEGGCNWSVQLLPPLLESRPDRGNLDLNHHIQYDVINFPDVIHPDYIGTPLFPAPCHATVWALPNRIVEARAFEYYHFVGETEGVMYLDYTSWDNYDFIEVYHGGKRVATTLDADTGDGYLKFYYDARGTSNVDLMVRIVAKDFGMNDSLKSVYYSMYCPDVKGARENRHPCSSYWVTSAGHPTTEDQFRLTSHPEKRAILIDLESGNFDTIFELFDKNMKRLDAFTLVAHNSDTFEHWIDPDADDYNDLHELTVRATSAIGCDWTYYVHCPIEPPMLEVHDRTVNYRCISMTNDGTDINAPWEISKAALRFWGGIDHTLTIEFKAATDHGKRYAGYGTGPELHAAVNAVGGFYRESNETLIGEIPGNIDYNSWPLILNGRALQSMKVEFVHKGEVPYAELTQVPSAANGWIGRIETLTPAGGVQYIDMSVLTTAVYA